MHMGKIVSLELLLFKEVTKILQIPIGKPVLEIVVIIGKLELVLLLQVFLGVIIILIVVLVLVMEIVQILLGFM